MPISVVPFAFTRIWAETLRTSFPEVRLQNSAKNCPDVRAAHLPSTSSLASHTML
jgi:hypothetical protein